MALKLKSFSSTRSQVECTITGDHTVKFFMITTNECRTFLVEVDGKLMPYRATQSTLSLYDVIIKAAPIFQEVLRKERSVISANDFRFKTRDLTNYYCLLKAKNLNSFIQAINPIFEEENEGAIPIAAALMLTELPGLFVEPIASYSSCSFYLFSYKDGDKTLRVYYDYKEEEFIISTNVVSCKKPKAKPIYRLII